MTNIHKTLSLIAMAVVASTCAAHTSEFVVAPDGDDTNPGTWQKPFATLARARDAVRSLDKHDGELTTVTLRGGVYYLDETFLLEASDSGSPARPVVYRASPGERPVLSGGVLLKLEWEPDHDGVMRARLPDHLLDIDQLFVEGVRCPLARYPNYDSDAQCFGGTSADAVAPERVKSWGDPVGGYLHALHQSRWGSKHYRIAGATAEGNLTLHGGWQENRGGGFDEFYRGGFHRELLFVENIREELDAPGEWFIDAGTKTLYLNPLPGVDLTRAKIVGARHLELVLLRGTVDRPVRWVTFEGIDFRHTKRVFMEPYERLLRGDWFIARIAAVRFEGSRGLRGAQLQFRGPRRKRRVH